LEPGVIEGIPGILKGILGINGRANGFIEEVLRLLLPNTLIKCLLRELGEKKMGYSRIGFDRLRADCNIQFCY